MPMRPKRIGLEDVFTYTWFMFGLHDALPLLGCFMAQTQPPAAHLACVGLLKQSEGSQAALIFWLFADPG